MASIDWGTAICGVVIGWAASSKVDEAKIEFTRTLAAGSAEGVKTAWKQAAKKAKKAKAGASKGTGKNG